MQFTDRAQAAALLAKKLHKYSQDPMSIVLAIPRGGVELGAVLADELKLHLDVVVSKKIGAPGNPEFAIGSVNMRGEVTLNTEDLGTTPTADYVETEVAKVKQAIQEKLRVLRGTRPFPQLKGKHVIVVDDGIATGSTMKGALDYVRAQRPDVLVMAVPVAPTGARDQFDPLCDEVIILSEEPELGSVGEFYNDFPQVEDSRAQKLLATRWPSS